MIEADQLAIDPFQNMGEYLVAEIGAADPDKCRAFVAGKDRCDPVWQVAEALDLRHHLYACLFGVTAFVP